MSEGSSFFTPLLIFHIVMFLTAAILMGVQWYLIVVLIGTHFSND